MTVYSCTLRACGLSNLLDFAVIRLRKASLIVTLLHEARDLLAFYSQSSKGAFQFVLFQLEHVIKSGCKACQTAFSVDKDV